MSTPASQVRRTSLKSELEHLSPVGLKGSLEEGFGELPDPRRRPNRCTHPLLTVIGIGVLTIIAGGKGWEDMELYGQCKRGWLSQVLDLSKGVPSADTFRRVFESLRAAVWEESFRRWVQGLREGAPLDVIAIDGKVLRGSYDREQETPALHLVSAWSSEHQLVLSQEAVAEKSNEITAIPLILESLELEGTVVTLDAMGTQKTIAAQIVEGGGDYILPLKNNHPTLSDQVQTWFQTVQAYRGWPKPLHLEVESGHHRLETRQVWTFALEDLPPLQDSHLWANLASIVVVQRQRQLWNGSTTEVQFYLSSLSPDSPRLAPAIRAHWGIENSVHWVLDVNFGEDACRVRSLHATRNLALVRRYALNILRCDTTVKGSLRQKSKRAAMDDAYMTTLITQAFPLNSAH